MRRFLTKLWTSLFKKRRPREVTIVIVGIVLTVVAATELAWASFGGQGGDRVALAAGSLTGGLLVVAGGAIVGWRKAESRNH